MPPLTVHEADSLERKALTRWMNPRRFKAAKTAHVDYYFIARIDRFILGCVKIIEWDNKPNYDGFWLYGLIVKSYCRGLGIGEELCKEAIHKTQSLQREHLSLLVHESNFRARALYEKVGFQTTVIPKLQTELQEKSAADDLMIMRIYFR